MCNLQDPFMMQIVHFRSNLRQPILLLLLGTVTIVQRSTWLPGTYVQLDQLLISTTAHWYNCSLDQLLLDQLLIDQLHIRPTAH